MIGVWYELGSTGCQSSVSIPVVPPSDATIRFGSSLTIRVNFNQIGLGVVCGVGCIVAIVLVWRSRCFEQTSGLVDFTSNQNHVPQIRMAG